MARLIKRARKPRGYKLDGTRSQDMCTGCHSFGCDPMADSPAWSNKKARRRDAGQCEACGSNPCICKSDSSLNERKQLEDCASYKNRDKSVSRVSTALRLKRETGLPYGTCITNLAICDWDYETCLKILKGE